VAASTLILVSAIPAVSEAVEKLLAVARSEEGLSPEKTQLEGRHTSILRAETPHDILNGSARHGSITSVLETRRALPFVEAERQESIRRKAARDSSTRGWRRCVESLRPGAGQ
jgi:hypothetical protein